MLLRKTKKKEREHKERLREGREIRKKVVGDFFVDFSKFFRPWLHELTRQYKDRGEFPVMACWLLPSYYQDDNDKEIAAYASMLIKDDEKVMEHVEAFREMMGDSPSKWFRNRGFVALSIGKTQERRTGGMLNRNIAEYFSSVYEKWGSKVSAVNAIMLNMFGENRYMDKANTLRLVLAASGGFGLGLWTIASHHLKSPLTENVMALLKTFFPDYVRLHDVDAAIHLFGFERDCDFFYAALAYKELQKRNPTGCSRLATVYQKRYSNATMLTARYWLSSNHRGILPEIDLG